jgi:hypothetical protein
MVPPSLMIPLSVHRCHLQGDGNRVVRAKTGLPGNYTYLIGR